MTIPAAMWRDGDVEVWPSTVRNGDVLVFVDVDKSGLGLSLDDARRAHAQLGHAIRVAESHARRS